eukprot:Gb_37166 [translate_table: standard]
MAMSNWCVSGGKNEDQKEAQQKFRKWIAVQEERLNVIEAKNDRLWSDRAQYDDETLSTGVSCSEWNRTTNSDLQDPFIKWTEPYLPLQNSEDENAIKYLPLATLVARCRSRVFALLGFHSTEADVLQSSDPVLDSVSTIMDFIFQLPLKVPELNLLLAMRPILSLSIGSKALASSLSPS